MVLLVALLLVLDLLGGFRLVSSQSGFVVALHTWSASSVDAQPESFSTFTSSTDLILVRG